MLLALQIAFMLAYSSGVGAIGWFAASEMVPVSVRAAVQVCLHSVPFIRKRFESQSTSTSAYFIIAGIMPAVFMPLYTAIGAYSLLIFIIPAIIATIGAYFLMPETKDKDIADIMYELNNGRVRRTITPVPVR